MVALLLLSPWAAGCGGADGQLLSEWTLHVRGDSQSIAFPIHLDDQLPREVVD